MNHTLFESELKVMEIIWESEPVSAKAVTLIATDKLGWNKNTTYTVLKKLETKGYITRTEPGFVCTSRISKRDVSRAETKGLIDRLFGGSKKALFAALIEDEPLDADELQALRELVESKKQL